MRKLSFVVIILGICLFLFPKGRELYYDFEQRLLMAQLEEEASPGLEGQNKQLLESGFAKLNQILNLSGDAEEASRPTSNNNTNLPNQAVGMILIDKINVKLPILEGATKQNMKYAAAHLSETAPLGGNGNAAIAAHRAHTQGRLFNRLNELEIGDRVELRLKDQTDQVYEVYNITIVEPTEVSVLEGDARERIITLITCDPLINPTHRLIVKAKLVSEKKPKPNVVLN
ncbi:class C sortase [Paenibacillus sp. CAA11]|nr:class C sortase [Paenibacillus sp. CAA11]